MDAATIARLIQTAPNRETADHIASALKGKLLQAVATALQVPAMYGTADNRRGIVVQWGYQYPANSAAIARA